MRLNPYLAFDGRCREAMETYARVLGGRLDPVMTWGAGGIPASEIPPGWEDKVMHAELDLGDAVLMGADAPPRHRRPMAGISVTLHPASVAEGERVWAALAEGGEVTMPFAETFFAERFGMVTDRFGTPWMLHVARAAEAVA